MPAPTQSADSPVNFDLPAGLAEAVESYAYCRGLDVSDVVAEALSSYLDDREAPPAPAGEGGAETGDAQAAR